MRHLVVLHQVLVLVAFADVHVDDFIIFPEHRFHIRAMKRQVEDVAVIAPVGAKDDRAYVLCCLAASASGLLDLSVGVDPRRIDDLARRGGLLQAGGIAAFARRQPPLLPCCCQSWPSVMYTVCSPDGAPGVDLSLKDDLVGPVCGDSD